MEEFLEGADVARAKRVTPGMVRKDADAGHLRVAARTARGGRLYRPEDVDEYLREARERSAKLKLKRARTKTKDGSA